MIIIYSVIINLLLPFSSYASPNVYKNPLETDSNYTNYFQLSISTPLDHDVTVDYFTRAGTAQQDDDFIHTSGTATIRAGETSTLIGVDIVGDQFVEETENFFLVIHQPQGASFPDGVTEISSERLIIDDDIVVSSINTQQSGGNPSFMTSAFTGSQNCSQCHDGITDEQNKDVSIVQAWQSSMMANSARDPFWKAKFRSELNRTPNLTDVINDKCTRCHAPMANVEATVQQSSITAFDGGFFASDSADHSQAMDGVSCTLCHQIQNSTTLGTQASFSGHFEIDTNLSGIDRKLYGPYENIRTRPMQNNVSFTPEYSVHTKASELCATCHNLKTPYADANGNILSTSKESEFPEQMPYSEWLHSDYAKVTSVNNQSCQACHMSRSNGVIIASRPGNLSTARDNFAEHNFIGANLFMLNILQDYKTELGVLANDFSRTLSETESILNSSATVEIIQKTLDDTGLNFQVKINSTTGHKLPSSYPSRRVIVHITVKDVNNSVMFESGKINADGSVVGLESDQDLKSYEPHYQQISSAEQVQVYEAIMQNSDNEVTYTLLRAKQYIKDNRILPLGFDKSTAENDIKVVGNALNDSDFLGGSDSVRYTLSGLTDNFYQVNVELVYQTLAYAFAQDLFQDKSEEVNQFKQMYHASNHKTHIITQQQFTIQK